MNEPRLYGLLGKGKGTRAHIVSGSSNHAVCDYVKPIHTISATPGGLPLCRRCEVLAPLHEQRESK